MEKELKPVTKTNQCGEECEVYSRVCGYFRPVTRWNKGKVEEFKERRCFEIKKEYGSR